MAKGKFENQTSVSVNFSSKPTLEERDMKRRRMRAKKRKMGRNKKEKIRKKKKMEKTE